MTIIDFFLVRRVWRYQRANQNPYTSIEEEQSTHWPKEKKYKRTNTDLQLRLLPTLTDPIAVCLFSSKSNDFGLVLESTSVSSVNYGYHVRLFSSIPDSTFTMRYFTNNMSTGMFTVVLYRYFKEGRTVLLISPETGRNIHISFEMSITNTGWVCWPIM